MPQFRTYTDTRDGRVYKTVLMPDGKWWAAENLAWDGLGVDYDNDPANRAIYGRLYTYADAQICCPTGTHLPSEADYLNLYSACGGSEIAGRDLKAVSSLWTTDWGVNSGLDPYGFSALPAGIHYNSKSFSYKHYSFDAWTSDYWYCADISSGYNLAFVSYSSFPITSAVSVRFIVDSSYIPDNPFQILTPCTLQMLCDSKVANSSSGRRRTVSRDSSFVFLATLNLPSECEQFESVPYYNFPVIGDCEIRQLDLVKYTFRDTEKTSSVKCVIVPNIMQKRTGDFRISCEPNISVDEAMLVATGSSSLEVLSSSRSLSLKCVWTVSFLAATQFIEWLRGSVNRIFTTSVGGMKGVACQIGDSVSLEIGSADVKISADLAIVNTKQFPLNVTASRVGNVVTVSTGTGYTGTLVNRSGEIVEVVATHTNVLTFTTYPENCYLLIRQGNNVTEWLEL